MADSMLQADALAVFTGYKDRVDRTRQKYSQTLAPYLADPPEPSENEREAYVISAMKAGLSRWRGNRDYEDLIRRVIYVENGDLFQAAITVNKNDIRRRSKALSQQMKIAETHGIAVAAQPDEICKTLLQNGAATAWVDGQNFFATAHPVDPFDPGNANTWANYNAARNLTAANFAACHQEMLAYAGWNGQPVELADFTLIVPPGLYSTGQYIVEADLSVGSEGTTASGGNTNIHKNKAKLVVSQKLSNQNTTWYLAAKWYGVLPGLVLQESQPVEYQYLGPGSDNEFERNEYKYGVSYGIEGAHLWAWCIYRNN